MLKLLNKRMNTPFCWLINKKRFKAQKTTVVETSFFRIYIEVETEKF